MNWLIGFLFFGFIGLLGLLYAIFGGPDKTGQEVIDPRLRRSSSDVPPRGFGVALCVVILLLQFGWALMNSVHSLPGNEVGVIRTFGRITGQTDCTYRDHDRNPATDEIPYCGGLTIIWPWQSLEGWNIREELVFSDERCEEYPQWTNCLASAALGGSSVFIAPKLSVQVTPENVAVLASTVGKSYIDRIVRPAMKTMTKNITINVAPLDVLQQRAILERQVAEALAAELTSRYSIKVTRMSFENIDFMPNFNASLEAKAEEEQKRALAALQDATIRQQNLNNLLKAEGDAAVRRAQAEGEAQANNTIAESLTPALLQWRTAQLLADNIQIALIPSGEGIIIDPATLLTPQ